jgi:hypothetical protein
VIDFHERLKDDVAAYALGTLDDEQARSRVEAHLADCDECRGLLDEYRAVVTQLPRALSGEAPSPAVRERLLARIQEEPAPRFFPRPAAFAARTPPETDEGIAVPAAAVPPPLADDDEAPANEARAASTMLPAAAAAARRAAAAPPPQRSTLMRISDYIRHHGQVLAGLGAAAVVVLVIGVVATQRGGSSKQKVQRSGFETQIPAPPRSAPVAPSPSVGVSPTSGSSSQSFVFSGSGFAPGEVIDVNFAAPSGANVPWRSSAGGSQVVADPSGRFNISISPGTALTDGTVGNWRARFIGRRSGEQDVGFSVLR